MTRRLRLFLLVLTGAAAPAWPGQATREPCRPARYELAEALGTGDATTTTVEVGQAVGLGRACAPAEPRVQRPTRRGTTKLRMRWDGCDGLAGRVKLAATIVDDCTRLVGRLRAGRLRRRVEAVRSECAPGIFDVLPPAVPYEPTRQSLSAHALPAWFADAKFGIMIHWGIYTIPAWAPLELDPADWLSGRLLEPPDYGREFFTKIPYVEWYPNSLLIEGSPVQAHHAATWGPEVTYDGFRPAFDAAAAVWSGETWADAFASAGARYVVLVTKHHDGYALWPSGVPHPTRAGWHTSRDFVGELSAAVRRRCLRMGLYYSGGLDWSVRPGPITDVLSVPSVIPNTPEYLAYANAQWRELIARYRPAVLWNDIGYPSEADALALFADYYNALPDGVVNDRFSILSGGTHHDYVTPEFTVLPDISERHFETVRGMGRGFGYNQSEGEDDYDSAASLIHLLADVVSKNGNLLLNVGPMADGTIPAPQMQRLQAIGAWLAINGEAIFDTRPWSRAAGATTAGTPVRYTASRDGGAVYAILLGSPAPGTVTLRDVGESPAVVELLGRPGGLVATRTGDDLTIDVPEPLPDQPAHAFALRR